MTHVPTANMMEEGIYGPLQPAMTGVDGNVWASLLGNNRVIYPLQIIMCKKRGKGVERLQFSCPQGLSLSQSKAVKPGETLCTLLDKY